MRACNANVPSMRSYKQDLINEPFSWKAMPTSVKSLLSRMIIQISFVKTHLRLMKNSIMILKCFPIKYSFLEVVQIDHLLLTVNDKDLM